MPEHKQNLENENLWYTENPWLHKKHLLNRYPFTHPMRHRYAYEYARQKTRRLLIKYLDVHAAKIDKLLIAPCGTEADLDILHDIANRYYGIDAAQEALKKCPDSVSTVCGDILQNPYPDEFFDMAASIFFFHHVHKVGFEPFVKQFFRVLKPGGIFVTLEPGDRYPVVHLAGLGRKIFGNISGLVPDEAPISPAQFTKTLSEYFTVDVVRSVSFSHNRIPLPVQYAINFLSTPLAGFKSGWFILWICRKSAGQPMSLL